MLPCGLKDAPGNRLDATGLDTNVVVSALLWDGLPRRLLRAGYDSDVTLLTSFSLLAELTDVLSRPKFEKRILLSRLSVEQLVDVYAQQTVSVRPLSVPRLAPDPDDDVVIGTALAAKADLIVTGDRALLSVSEYGAGRIVSVPEALRIILD